MIATTALDFFWRRIFLPGNKRTSTCGEDSATPRFVLASSVVVDFVNRCVRLRVLFRVSRERFSSHDKHAGKIEAQLKVEVAELLARAEAADQADVSDGMSIPEELARRQERFRSLPRRAHISLMQ